MQKLTMESIQITGVCIVLQSVRNEHKQSGTHDERTHNTLYHTKVRTYETRHSSTGQQRGHDDVDSDCNMVTASSYMSNQTNMYERLPPSIRK